MTFFKLGKLYLTKKKMSFIPASSVEIVHSSRYDFTIEAYERSMMMYLGDVETLSVVAKKPLVFHTFLYDEKVVAVQNLTDIAPSYFSELSDKELS